MTRIFYTGTKNASSWSFRAWLALREQQLSFEERVVDLRVPQRFANLAEIKRFSPPGGVPVLVEDGVVIFDSLAIMEFASELGSTPLLPQDRMLRAKARALMAWQHAGLSGICGDLTFESAFYEHKRAMKPHEVQEAHRLFSVWEAELSNSAGPYLCGTLSLADLAFAPTVVRLWAHQAPLDDFPLSSAWGERLLARASLQEWLQAARALPAVIEADYLA